LCIDERYPSRINGQNEKTALQKEALEIKINMNLKAHEVVSISVVSYKWCPVDRKVTAALSNACGPLLTFSTNF